MASRRFIIPSKLPPDYKRRVLQRLFPPTDLSKLDKAQLIDIAERRDKIAHLIDSDPVRFFVPSKGGQTAFMTAWDKEPSVYVLIYAAGNKAGKTTGSVILELERIVGHAVWHRKKREAIHYTTPAVALHCSEDFDSHKETILPTLHTWGKPFIQKIYYNNLGQPTEVAFKNDSLIRFKTYAQGADSAEGKDFDMVSCDEPPPRNFYTAVFRGLVARGGRMTIAATLLKEAWVFDEGANPYVRVFGGTIHENTHISQEAKLAFLNSLTPEEREVRELGKPINLVGLIYKNFADQPPWVVPNFALPEDCPYFMGVDPHERKPVHIAWGFLTQRDEIVWFDWLKVGGATKDIFEAIKAREKARSVPRPVTTVIMDPNRGRARQINETSWENEFLKQGYYVVLGKDNIDIGHTKMHEYLQLNERTNRPRMMWTEACRGQGGPIHQMQRYAWDDWVVNSRVERDKKERPRQVNKDFPDIFRYAAMEDLCFDQLFYGPRVIEGLGEGFKAYGRMH